MAYDSNSDVALGILGSAYIDTATPVYPPQGMVIRAITFLADNIPTVMDTEILDGSGPQYFGTNSTEATAANYLGVTEQACTGARTTVFLTNDTVTIDAENTKIKVGQYVLLVNDSDTVSAGITVDSETETPIYNGPNKAGVKVLKVNGVNITLDTVLTPTSSQTLIFLDENHGAGGVESDSAKFPKGITVYGRWVKFTPAAATGAGGQICYFGH
tara:strand:- start:268 stop:912 length:645 start_codon:yes stop_codon:yes gene_type:complete